MGLANKNLVIIASSDDHYIALSCDDDLYGKVLAIDSGVYPEDYPPGVAKTMANVAILADSFDNFLQSIFYYQRQFFTLYSQKLKYDQSSTKVDLSKYVSPV